MMSLQVSVCILPNGEEEERLWRGSISFYCSLGQNRKPPKATLKSLNVKDGLNLTCKAPIHLCNCEEILRDSY